MKKLYLLFLVCILAFPAYSQIAVVVAGTVTDISTGMPIVNQPVLIQSDSTGGFIYTNMVYTNPNGFYSDNVPVANPQTGGVITVSTVDCQQYNVVYNVTYAPGASTVVQNFLICAPLGNCVADFIYSQGPPLSVSFVNTSLGGSSNFSWNFGDGMLSNESDPIHTYTSPGYYYVTLAIGIPNTTCSDYITKIVQVGDSTAGGCQSYFTYSTLPGATYNAIQFYDQSQASGQINWIWNFGDPASGTNNTSNVQNPAHVFPTTAGPAYYNVCLTVTSNDSTCNDTYCYYVLINEPLPCNSSFTYASSPNAPGNIDFTDLSTGNINTWIWDFGDGVVQTITAPGNPNVSHVYANQGVYNACLNILGDSCSSTYCQNVIVGDTIPGCQSYFSFTIDSTNSNNYQVYFTDYSTGDPVAWFWDFGDGTTSTEQNPVHTYPVIQPYSSYSVCLTITSSSGLCTSTYCKMVFIIPTLGCSADFLTYQVPGTSPLTVMFDDISIGDIETWTWEFGDGTTQTINYPFSPDVYHTYADPGFYTACLYISGSDSCFASYCALVAVGDSTLPCQAQFTYYVNDSLNIGSSVQFLDLSTGQPNQWLWDFGDGTTSGLQNPIHTYNATGTFYVCLTIFGSSCQSVWCATVEVGNTVSCASYFAFNTLGQSVNFQGYMLDGSPADYFWDFGDNQTGIGENIVHTYTTPGMYFVTLTTTSNPANPCTYTSSQMITVGDSTVWNQVYGQVYAGTFPVSDGFVMIFSLDTTNTFLPFVEISMLDSAGVYYFPMVPQGNYVIYAIPFASGFLPTYYGDVLFWENATVVSLGTAANPYNINLISADPGTPGGGSVGGQVSQGDIAAAMIDKITMLLKDSDGNTIQYSEVSEAGEFDFPQLAYGTYYLYAELAGCESQNVKVVISEAIPNAEVNLLLSGNSILGGKELQLELQAGVVTPNPVKGEAFLDVNLQNANDLTIELYNMQGQKVLTQAESLGAGESRLHFNLDHLSSGIYTLRIYTRDGLLLTRKLIKTN
ncbi:MAG: PKD domain-containing protein [Bacteroidales bacterium]|nr:PKD domain-containing protein [Bacteroidales bacterium]